MVGQKKIIEDLSNLNDRKSFPRFMIISGVKGSGRKTLTQAVSKMLGAFLVQCDLGVDSVREAIENSYKCAMPTVYLFADADKMSASAKNSLLKITEEPPRQAYFVMTVNMLENTLETLTSRATCVQMLPYTKQELREFVEVAGVKILDDEILEVSEVPGQVLEFSSTVFSDMMEFCNMVIDNITKVTGVNAFKIINRIKLKEDKDGYDPDLFFQCLRHILVHRCIHPYGAYDLPTECYANMLKVTARYQRELHLTGVKKDSTLDMWVLEMRECG